MDGYRCRSQRILVRTALTLALITGGLTAASTANAGWTRRKIGGATYWTIHPGIQSSVVALVAPLTAPNLSIFLGGTTLAPSRRGRFAIGFGSDGLRTYLVRLIFLHLAIACTYGLANGTPFGNVYLLERPFAGHAVYLTPDN